MDNKKIAEVDLYINLNNLKIVEVEFESEKEANNFKPPKWFGKEVTYNLEYKNKNLALRGEDL